MPQAGLQTSTINIGASQQGHGQTNPLNALKRNTGYYYNDPYEDYDKEENVPAKYTEEQVQYMLTNSKFFIIKSANEENIKLSREHSEWATTRSNEVTHKFKNNIIRGNSMKLIPITEMCF